MSSIRVLYIAGVGRSGSTILGRVLGEDPGTVFVGEALMAISQGKLFDDSSMLLCGCGELLHECPYWNKVRSAYNQKHEASPSNVPYLSHRTRNLLFRRHLPAKADTKLSSFYEAVRQTSSADMIVDGSKYPSYLYALSADKNIDLSVLHLVRDPRAVVNSRWNRPLDHKDAEISIWNTTSSHFKMHNPIRVGLEWLEWNHMLHRLWGKREGKYYLLKYENFCKDPEGAIDRAGKVLNYDFDLDWKTGNTLSLGRQHSAKGNPNRFERGSTRIRLSEKWRNELSLPTRLVAKLFALLFEGLAKFQ